MRHAANRRHNAQGATLVELMVALAVLGLVMAGVFGQLGAATQRLTAEQVKVDNFDEARDFVDQFFRDINQIGYPNGRMMSFLAMSPASALTASQADSRVAVGLVKIENNAIWFEGDVNGSGVVQSVQYKVNGANLTVCSLCLQRSSVDK